MIIDDKCALDLKSAFLFRFSAQLNHDSNRHARCRKTGIHLQVASIIDACPVNGNTVLDVILLSDLPRTTEEELVPNNVDHARLHHLCTSTRLSVAFKEQFAIRIG